MNLIVTKFGGSSVANNKLLDNVSNIIIKKIKKENKIIVVVSAPGDMTDDLINRAYEITPQPDERELDMLMSTGEQISIALLSIILKAKGYDAISLTGPQAGIYADTSYTKARITSIKPKKIFDELNKGRIVIVAGFQGLNPYDDITTLGRGGSDLTAVALAAVTKAKICEIYTDVDGVFSVDPRICKDAKKIDYISYDEMLEMSGSGAQVMQARAVEVAKKFNIKIEVKSSFNDKPGTIIFKEGKQMEQPVVTSVTYDKNQAKLSILNIPDKPGVAAKIFSELAKYNVNVDMIIQSSAREGHNDISFTVTKSDLRKSMEILQKINKELSGKGVIYDDKIAKVSIIGVGMKSYPGVAAKMFETLAKNKINIEMISTSEIKISCVIKDKFIEKAVKLLYNVFISNRRNQ